MKKSIFENRNLSWEELSKAIIQNLKKTINLHQLKYVDTYSFLKSIADLADGEKFQAFFKDNPKKSNAYEWIWDLAILEHNYKVKDEDEQYKRPILVAESEWGKKYCKMTNKKLIKDDFYKLLEAKCKWKIMNFEIWRFGKKYLQEIKDKFEKILNAYELTDDEEYIFICWDEGECKMRCFHAKKVNGKTKFSEEKIIPYKDLGL